MEIGDYVHAAHYSDYHPYDPWRVGYVTKIEIGDNGSVYYTLDGDKRRYRHARKITKEEGDQIILSYKMNTEL